MEYTKIFHRKVFDKNSPFAKIMPDISRKLQSIIADNCVLFIGFGENIPDMADNEKLYYAIPKTFPDKAPWPKIRPFKTVAVDVNFLPFAAETFDVVIINHYLEFFDENTKFLNEIFRILKRNGKTAITVINERNSDRKLFPGKIRTIKEIISDLDEALFHVSDIWGINKKAGLLSYNFDYNQKGISEMLLGLFRLLSDIMIITADKTGTAPEPIQSFGRLVIKEEYGAI